MIFTGAYESRASWFGWRVSSRLLRPPVPVILKELLWVPLWSQSRSKTSLSGSVAVHGATTHGADPFSAIDAVAGQVSVGGRLGGGSGVAVAVFEGPAPSELRARTSKEYSVPLFRRVLSARWVIFLLRGVLPVRECQVAELLCLYS